MYVTKLVAMTIGIFSLADAALAQTPFQSYDASLKIYAVGDLGFPYFQEKPSITLECDASTGRKIYGTRDYTPHTQGAFAVLSGAGANWEDSSGSLLHGRRYMATMGSIQVEALSDLGDIHFAEASALLEALRNNPTTLTISLTEKITGHTVAVENFNTSGVDVCRFAYACGNQDHRRAACGPTIRPPSPEVRTLKRDIEAVLSRYPTDP